jgi:hypothetical protein
MRYFPKKSRIKRGFKGKHESGGATREAKEERKVYGRTHAPFKGEFPLHV